MSFVTFVTILHGGNTRPVRFARSLGTRLRHGSIRILLIGGVVAGNMSTTPTYETHEPVLSCFIPISGVRFILPRDFIRAWARMSFCRFTILTLDLGGRRRKRDSWPWTIPRGRPRRVKVAALPPLGRQKGSPRSPGIKGSVNFFSCINCGPGHVRIPIRWWARARQRVFGRLDREPIPSQQHGRVQILFWVPQ